MRRPTSANTKRAQQAQPLQPREEVPFPERAGGAELGLITRDAAIRTSALTGLLVGWDAAKRKLDVLCARGTAPSAASVTGAHEPLDASIGVARWRATTTAEELLAAAGLAPRTEMLTGGGNVVTAGDVAAGAGRGAVVALDRVLCVPEATA